MVYLRWQLKRIILEEHYDSQWELVTMQTMSLLILKISRTTHCSSNCSTSYSSKMAVSDDQCEQYERTDNLIGLNLLITASQSTMSLSSLYRLNLHQFFKCCLYCYRTVRVAVVTSNSQQKYVIYPFFLHKTFKNTLPSCFITLKLAGFYGSWIGSAQKGVFWDERAWSSN